MTANSSSHTDHCRSISQLLDVIGEPARIQILYVLSNGDSCVCHLEAALHLRQASISQHLMVLRQAGLVCAQREGRHIFYRLGEPAVLSLLDQAAALRGLSTGAIRSLGNAPVPGCTCPNCNPSLDSKLVCQKVPNHE